MGRNGSFSFFPAVLILPSIPPSLPPLLPQAIAALQRTLSLNPNVTAARHLLLSISGGEGGGEGRAEGGGQVPVDTDPAYVVELFDYYAPTYDQHMKEG